jgi:acyl-CoA thioester hydrolase
MTEFVHSSAIQVRYAETDAMKFVYYANHLVYWEVARTEALAAIGFPYRELEEQGCAIPVIQAHCEYHAPARFGDTLVVLSRPSLIDRLRVRFEYETRRGTREGILIASGWTHHVCMDARGAPRRPPKELAARLDPGTRPLPNEP